MANKTKKVAKSAEQQDYKVGYGKPPEGRPFKPGQSGNPNGPPKHRTNLWLWITKYMDMTDAEIAKLDRTKLTQAQKTALNIVEKAANGKYSGSQKLARYIADREEGKAHEYKHIEHLFR